MHDLSQFLRQKLPEILWIELLLVLLKQKAAAACHVCISDQQ